MIKLVYVIHRRPDVSEADFYDYWLNTHGPLVRNLAKTIRAKKYVQSHLIDNEASEGLRSSRGMLPPVAGITELWWDSLEDFVAANATPECQAAGAELAADEAKFIDIKSSQLFMTEEHVILDYTDRKPLGEKSVKCVYLVVKRHDLTQTAMCETWKNDHGPLFISLAEAVAASKYIQSHTTAHELNASIATSRGFAPPLDGITEVWVADPEASLGGEDSAKAVGILIEDEKRFVQLDESRCFLTKEHVIFDYS